MQIMTHLATIPAPEADVGALRELAQIFSFVLTPITVLVTILTCIAAATVAAAIVNPNVNPSPFDYDCPMWARWAWIILGGGTLVGPLILGILAFNHWGYLLAVAIVLGASLVALTALRAFGQRR